MLFNPIDCLRIRWQVTPKDTAKKETVWSFAKTIARSEGFVNGLWKPGIFANGLSIGLCTAVRFVSYAPLRDLIGTSEKSPLSMAMAGYMSGSMGYLTVTPFFQLKTRLQVDTGLTNSFGIFTTGARVGKKRMYDSTFDAVRKIVTDEGPLALYRGALPLVVRGSLLSAGHLGGYDGFKTFAKTRGWMDEGVPLHFAASVSAAFFGTVLSNPADVVMTRWASAPTIGKSYRSISHCVRSIINDEGPIVLYRGWSVFFLRVAPLLCVMMPLFEQTRRLFGLGYSK